MTSIVRRGPFPARHQPFGIGSLRHAMDRLFDDSFFRTPLAGSAYAGYEAGSLPIDISEQDQQLVVRASLPGYGKDEVDVQLKEGVLSIKAEHEQTEDTRDEKYYRRERRYGAVSRRIALPTGMTDAKVEGELKDGVLTLTVEVPEREQARSIELKQG